MEEETKIRMISWLSIRFQFVTRTISKKTMKITRKFM